MSQVFNAYNVTTSRITNDETGKTTIEVREHTSGRLLFTVGAKEGALEQQLSAYCSGLLTGIDTGKTQLQEEIRNVLGIN